MNYLCGVILCFAISLRLVSFCFWPAKLPEVNCAVLIKTSPKTGLKGHKGPDASHVSYHEVKTARHECDEGTYVEII